MQKDVLHQEAYNLLASLIEVYDFRGYGLLEEIRSELSKNQISISGDMRKFAVKNK